MSKVTFWHSILLIAVMAFVITGCKNPSNPAETPEISITGEFGVALSFTVEDGVFSPASIQLGYLISVNNPGLKSVVWSVEPEGVVTVNGDGLVTPIAVGNAVITVRCNDYTINGIPISASIDVSVNPGGGGNHTPVAADFTFGNLIQTAGSVVAVTIIANSGKSPGVISNIRYTGNTTIPQTEGTYAVTFDVAAADGWNAVTGLSAGNLVVNPVGGNNPVSSVSISGAQTFGTQKYLYLAPNGTATLTAAANADAANQIINWSSSLSTGAGSVSVVNGALTADASASGTYVTISAVSAEDADIKDTVKVIVIPDTGDIHDTGANWKDQWSFRTAIDGWMPYEGDDTMMNASAALTGGLTLHPEIIDGDMPQGIRWLPFYAASGVGTAGILQTSGHTLPITVSGTTAADTITFDPMDANRKYFAEIANVSVPFKLTLYYSNTGSSRPYRYPIVYVDGTYIGTEATGSNSTTVVSDSFNYYGSGETTVTVQLGNSSGLRIYDIIIEKIDAPGPDLNDAVITVNVEADFAGLDNTITLKKTGTPSEKTITFTRYSTALWYIDGVFISNDGSLTLEADDFDDGDHDLAIIVTINGYWYSKTVTLKIEG